MKRGKGGGNKCDGKCLRSVPPQLGCAAHETDDCGTSDLGFAARVLEIVPYVRAHAERAVLNVKFFIPRLVYVASTCTIARVDDKPRVKTRTLGTDIVLSVYRMFAAATVAVARRLAAHLTHSRVKGSESWQEPGSGSCEASWRTIKPDRRIGLPSSSRWGTNFPFVDSRCSFRHETLFLGTRGESTLLLTRRSKVSSQASSGIAERPLVR